MPLDLSAIDAALGSRDETVRWQAASALGAYCETSPEMVWPLTVKWGSCATEDVRAAISTCVLEHLLEHHFAEYLPKTRSAVHQSNHFADTFSGCWKLGQAAQPENAEKWDELEAFIRATTDAKLKIAVKQNRYERQRQAGAKAGAKTLDAQTAQTVQTL